MTLYFQSEIKKGQLKSRRRTAGLTLSGAQAQHSTHIPFPRLVWPRLASKLCQYYILNFRRNLFVFAFSPLEWSRYISPFFRGRCGAVLATALFVGFVWVNFDWFVVQFTDFTLRGSAHWNFYRFDQFRREAYCLTSDRKLTLVLFEALGALVACIFSNIFARFRLLWKYVLENARKFMNLVESILC